MRLYTILLLKRIKGILFSGWYLAAIIALILVALYCNHHSTAEYHNTIASTEEFSKSEKMIIERMPDYDKYSDHGHRVYFEPSAISIFFSNPVLMNALYARFNSLYTLTIDNNAKTSLIFRRDYPFPLRYAFILLVLGSLSALYFGVMAKQYKYYLKMQAGIVSNGMAYAVEIGARTMVILFSLVILTAVNLVYAGLAKIPLTAVDIAGIKAHFLAVFIMLLCFFFAGFLIAFLDLAGWKRNAIPLTLWGIFVVAIPMAVYSYIHGKAANLTSPYKVELGKVTVISDFEKWMLKTYGTFERSKVEIGRQGIEKYYNIDQKKSEGYEKRLLEEITGIVEESEDISAWTPVSFYLSVCDEAGGQGYRSYIQFYQDLIDMQRRFLRFWIDHVFWGNPQIMAYFLQGRENIYRSRSRLPNTYVAGVAISLVYLILLAFFSVMVYLKRMKGLDKKILPLFGKKDIVLTDGIGKEFVKGAVNEFNVVGTGLRDLLCRVFSGEGPRLVKKGLQFDVWLEKNNLCRTRMRVPFLYLCSGEYLPAGLKVKDLLSDFATLLGMTPSELKSIKEQETIKPLLKKTMGELEDYQRFEAAIALLTYKKKDVYILEQVDKGLPKACIVKLKRKIDGLLEQGAVVIVLTPVVPRVKQEEGKKAIVLLINGMKKLFKRAKKSPGTGVPGEAGEKKGIAGAGKSVQNFGTYAGPFSGEEANPFFERNVIWTCTAEADYKSMEINGLL